MTPIEPASAWGIGDGILDLENLHDPRGICLAALQLHVSRKQALYSTLYGTHVGNEDEQGPYRHLPRDHLLSTDEGNQRDTGRGDRSGGHPVQIGCYRCPA